VNSLTERSLTRAQALAELRAHGPGWLDHSVDRYAGLIDDGVYLHAVKVELRRRFGSINPEIVFDGLRVVNLRVGHATHASQDGYDAAKLLALLSLPEPAPADETEISGVVCAIRDGARLMIYDGNHRYADACLRGVATVRARVLVLG
jgi:hypothetical protein